MHITDIIVITHPQVNPKCVPTKSMLEELLSNYTTDRDYQDLRLEEDWDYSGVRNCLCHNLDNYIVKVDDYNLFNFVPQINLLVLGEKYMKLKDEVAHMSWEDFQNESIEAKLSLYDKSAVFVFVDLDGTVTVGTLAQLLRRAPEIKGTYLKVDSLYSRHASW